MGRNEAGLNSFEQLSISAGWLDCGPSSPTLQVLFLYPGDTLPLGEGSVVAASFPPLLGGSPQSGLNWGLNTRVVSHLIAAVLDPQSHGAVARVVWEDVRDVEVKTLQDVCGLHLPRETETKLEQGWLPQPQPQEASAPREAFLSSSTGQLGSRPLLSLRGKVTSSLPLPLGSWCGQRACFTLFPGP